MEKRRLYATEHDALIKLRVAENVLRHLRDQNQLGERAKLVPYGARDLGGAISGVERLLENLLETVPDNQRKTISRNVASASYTIGVKRPGGTRNVDDWGMWISLRSLNQLLEGLHDHCLMCDKDLSQQKACPLKKALDELPSDIPDKRDGGCRFHGIV